MSCLDFVSIFLNSCLISEGWKLEIDLEYHCIMNNIHTLHNISFKNNKHHQVKSVKIEIHQLAKISILK